MGRELTRQEPESSLATKIILLVFVATFMSAAAVSWISIETARRQLWSQIHRTYPAMLERSGQHLLRQLAAGRAVVAGLAGSEDTRRLLEVVAREAVVPARRETARTLLLGLVAAPAERSPEISGFALLGRDGELLLESEGQPPLSIADRAALVRPGAPLVEGFPSPDGVPRIATAVPVLDARYEPIAYLIGFFRSDALRDGLAANRLDGNMRVEILDGAGHVLVHAGMPDEVPPNSQRPPILEPGEVREYTSATREHVIGSTHHLGALGWALLVETSYQRAFAPVRSVLQRLLLIDVCVVALASLLAYAITSSIVRPIEALSEGARLIASGRFDLELPDTARQDELGLLTRTFNDMVRRVRGSQAALETANRRLRDQNESLQASNEILEQLSITDGLTKLHNHRFLQDHLSREIKRVNRTGEPLSLILVDIDNFKRLNDRLGHAAGDEALQWVARVLGEAVRDSDLVARYGGEEFAILASNTELAGAVVLAEKARAAVAASPFCLDESVRPVPITVSIGVAQYKGDRKKFFQAADQGLYRAKGAGKDCVRVSE
jgi:diguanylate cyclase (GGDEF)-like protein